jgi:acyl-CoA synthetase (NDP forming)
MRRYSEHQDVNLYPFFEPESLAIVGSLRNSEFGAQVVLDNLLNFGYSGRCYLVNPSYTEVKGIKVYPTIRDVPESVDLAIVITPSQVTPGIMKDCAEKGVKGAIIVADGFAEMGEAGTKLQSEIVEIANYAGIRVLGPNTVGTANTATGLVTTPYFTGYSKISRGGIAFAAQTGLIGPQALPYGDPQFRISKICDFGNKCDVDEIDLLEYLSDDPETKVIAMHLECIREGNRFLKTARRVGSNKPILILKPGRTKESAKALISHTGSLIGEQKVYESAFKQAGIIQVDSFKDLFEIPKAFLYQPLPKGNRLGIVTITGGAGIMAIDTAIESGLALAQLSAETKERLSEIDPTLVSNPLDVGPLFARTKPPYSEIIEAILNDRNVDCLLVVGYIFSIPLLSEIRNSENKPIVFWAYGPNSRGLDEFQINFENDGYPVFRNLRTAVRALGAMYQYANNRGL